MSARFRWVLVLLSLGCALGPVATGSCATPAYPERPIRFILPFPPGGAGDAAARIVAQHLSVALGQPVVVDNRSGANGIVGIEMGAKSKPDGYTIIFAWVGPLAVNPSLYQSLPYRPEDFEPVALIADAVSALMVHSSFPAKSVQEYIALAKAQPAKLSYGSSGNGNAGHLAGELFDAMAGINVVHVPFKGGGPLMTNLVGGHIPVVFGTLSPGLPHMRAGKIRVLAVTSSARASMAPDVPTIAEAGLPSYEASNWYGVVAPAGTPRPVVTRLNEEIVKILRMQEVRDAFASHGLLPLTGTPEDFRAYIRSETEKWSRLVKSVGIKAD